MALSLALRERIISHVKKEPCTVQDVARITGVSWVTAERYIQQIHRESGEVRLKVFREGTRGALKIVYHATVGATHRDELEKTLYQRIRSGRFKHHFDFFEIFQYVNDQQKQAKIWDAKKHPGGSAEGLVDVFRQATTSILIFSGNLSFISLREKNTSILSVLEECLSRGVHIKILARINVATIRALSNLEPLLIKYPSNIEIRHAYQPLRGFVIDDTRARFKDDENQEAYRSGELESSLSIFYEIHDEQWVSWLSRVYWNLWRTSIDAKKREEEIRKIMTH